MSKRWAEDGSGQFNEDPKLPGNRWKELQAQRPTLRAQFIEQKLMPDPSVRYRLDEAITMKGVCEDMCPEYERHEREGKGLVDPWEYLGGPTSTDKPHRIDHSKAVKIYQRGSGDTVLPSDLRTVKACVNTISYLWRLADKEGLPSTHAFVRDRARAVRLDMRIQHLEEGTSEGRGITEECARFHILSLHALRHLPSDKFDFGTESEQIGQTLQSLRQSPEPHSLSQNPEFMAYYILFHIRNEPPRVEGEDLGFLPPIHSAPLASGKKLKKSLVVTFTLNFRERVKKSSPTFGKRSELKIDAEGVALWVEFENTLLNLSTSGEEYIEEVWAPHHRRSVIFLLGSLLEWNFGGGCVVGLGDKLKSLKRSETGGEVLGVVECDKTNGSDAPLVRSPPQASSAPNPFASIQSTSDAPPIPAATQTSSLAPSPFGSSSFTQPGSSMNGVASPFAPSVNRTASPFLATSSTSPFAPSASPFATSNSGTSLGPSPFRAGATSPTPGGSLFSNPPSFSMPVSQSTPAMGASPFSSGGGLTESKSAPSGLPSGGPASVPAATSNNTAEATRSLFASGSGAPPFGSSAPFGAPTSTSPFVPGAGSSSTLFSSASGVSPFATSVPASAKADNAPSPFASSIPPSFANSTSNATPLQSPAAFNRSTAPSPSPSIAKTQSGLNPFATTFTPTSGNGGVQGLFSRTTDSKPPLFSSTAMPAAKDTSQSPFMTQTPAFNAPTSSPSLFTSPPSKGTGSTLFSTPPAANGASLFPPPPGPSSLGSSGNGTRPASPTLEAEKETKKQKMNDKTRVSSTLSNLPVSVSAPSILQHPAQARKTQPIPLKAAQQQPSPLPALLSHFLRTLIAQQAAVTLSEEFRHRSAMSKLRPLWDRWKTLALRKLDRTLEELKRAEEWKDDGGRRRKRARYVNGEEGCGKLVAERAEKRKRHWEPGTFKEIVKSQLHASGCDPIPPDWTVLLSVADSQSAISMWLRTKFGVDSANSGLSRKNLSVISLAALAGRKRDGEGMPGLIVFECTPLQGLDLQERGKILEEDCRRLLSVVDSLSNRRHYRTALVVIVWGGDLALPVSATVNSVERELGSAAYVHFGAADEEDDDPHDVFQDVLSTMELDATGLLLTELSVHAIVREFLKPWDTGLDSAIGLCRGADTFNWQLNGYVLSSFIGLLNTVGGMVQQLQDTRTKYEIWKLPNLNGGSGYSTPAAAVATLKNYLESPSFGGDEDARALKVSLSDNERSNDKDYTGSLAVLFIRGLAQILQNHLEGSLAKQHQSLRVRVLRARMQNFIQSFNDELQRTLSDLKVLRGSVAVSSWKTTVSTSSILNGDVNTSDSTISGSRARPSSSSQAPLTLEDLQPLSNAAKKASIHIDAPPHPSSSSTAPLPAESVKRTALRSRAQEVLAKYKNKSNATVNGADDSMDTSFRSSSSVTEDEPYSRPPSSLAQSLPAGIGSPFRSLSSSLRRKPSFTDVLQQRTEEVRMKSMRSWGGEE